MSEFPAEGRLLGVDYGSKRVGLAVSDPGQFLAGPLELLPRSSPQAERALLMQLIDEYQIKGIILGLPVHQSGDESQKSREVRAYGEWLVEQTGLPVRYWDERHTSQLAEMHLVNADLSSKKRASRRDTLAAQLMLQRYLDAEDREAAPADLR